MKITIFGRTLAELTFFDCNASNSIKSTPSETPKMPETLFERKIREYEEQINREMRKYDEEVERMMKEQDEWFARMISNH